MSPDLVPSGTFSNGFLLLKHWRDVFRNEKLSLKVESVRIGPYQIMSTNTVADPGFRGWGVTIQAQFFFLI